MKTFRLPVRAKIVFIKKLLLTGSDVIATICVGRQKIILYFNGGRINQQEIITLYSK